MCVCVWVCVFVCLLSVCVNAFFVHFDFGDVFRLLFPLSVVLSIWFLICISFYTRGMCVDLVCVCYFFFFFFGESKRQSLHTCVYATSEHAYGKFYFFYALYLLVVFSCVYAILRYCVDSLFLKTDKQRILTQQRAQTLLSLKYQFLTKQNSHLVRQSST